MSTTRITHGLGPFVIALGMTPLMAAGQSPNFFALERFNEQVAAYMAVRHRIEQRLPAPTVTANATTIVDIQFTLANAIRQARPRARAGDFFSPEIAAEFQRRMHRALEQRGVSEGGLSADLQRESPATFCTLAVNGNFDWRFGAMMPTVVIEVLPDVPWPLQYRFVCRDLVLLDVDAGLIVDILPDALTAP